MKLSRNARKLVALTLSAALVLGGVAVNGSSASAAKKATLKLSKKSAKLAVGKKLTLKVKKKNVKSAKITWKSSKKSVASVSKKGVVKAKKAGKTKISATIKYKAKGSKKTKKKTLKCTVTVTKKSTVVASKAPTTSTIPNGTKAPDATKAPGGNATTAPTQAPGGNATTAPTQAPGGNATSAPTQAPGGNATSTPTQAPGGNATSTPTQAPGGNATSAPTQAPGGNATSAPTEAPLEKDFTITPVTAPVSIDINTITYKLNVTEVTTNTDIIFQIQDSSWGEVKTNAITIDSVGEKEATISVTKGKSLKNLGYIKSATKVDNAYPDVDNNTFKATIEKVIINGTYEVTLNTPVTTKESTDDSSKMKLDLPNVWYGDDNSPALEIGKDASGHTLYIPKNNGDILFGIPGKTFEPRDVKKMPINKIDYILDVDSITTPSEMTVEGTATIAPVNISEKKSYTFSGTLDAVKGFDNLGYIHAPEACGGIKASISTIKINDKEMKLTKSSSFGALDAENKYYELKLANIWDSLSNLEIVAIDDTADNMLIYSKTDNKIVFVQSMDTLTK